MSHSLLAVFVSFSLYVAVEPYTVCSATVELYIVFSDAKHRGQKPGQTSDHNSDQHPGRIRNEHPSNLVKKKTYIVPCRDELEMSFGYAYVHTWLMRLILSQSGTQPSHNHICANNFRGGAT